VQHRLRVLRRRKFERGRGDRKAVLGILGAQPLVEIREGGHGRRGGLDGNGECIVCGLAKGGGKVRGTGTEGLHDAIDYIFTIDQHVLGLL
jgi:hypothetical protein